jgi:anti-sigma factor RsiW
VNGSFPPPGDDELHSFLDGEIEPHRRKAIENFLKTSPGDAERVEGWRRQTQVIRAAFAPIEAEPAPASILLPPASGRRASLRLLRTCPAPPAGDVRKAAQEPPFWRKGATGAAKLGRAGAMPLFAFAVFAAGAIVALAGAFFADRLHAPQVAAEVRAAAPVAADDIPAARAIAALMDFKPQERANASGAAPKETRAASNQASLIVPNLSSVGFTLVGMRPAPARSGEPENQMFCLFYAKAAAPSVALCIARDSDGGGPGGFRVEANIPSDGSAGAISWRQANAIYTLAGPLGDGELRNLAKRVSAEIEAFD